MAALIKSRWILKEELIQSRETIVCGERITVFSCDGCRWFSNKIEAMNSQRRREKLLTERSKLLKRTATFTHSDRRARHQAFESSGNK